MDYAAQNGDKGCPTATSKSFGTSFGFGFAFGDQSNLGTEKYWMRAASPVAVEEPQPEPQPEVEPVAAPDPEPVPDAKLPDHPLYDNWDNLSSKDKKKREKLLIKKGLPVPGKDFDWPPPPTAPVEEKPELEPEPVVEKEPEPEPVPELEPEPESVLELKTEPEPKLAAKLPGDPLYSNWDNLSSKDKKKREKSLMKKGLPIPGKDFEWPPRHPALLLEDTGPQGAAEPEPEPTPEPVIEELGPRFGHSIQPGPELKKESPRPTSFPPQSERTVCAQSIAAGPSFLLSLLSNIRDTGAFSDLKIKCESSTFNAHCCIVCPQSSFFEKAIKDGSKEIKIINHSFVVEKMLDYLYRGDYDDYKLATEANGYLGQSSAPPRYVNAIMHVTAHEYDIGGLKDLAEKRLLSNLTHDWNDVDFIRLIKYVYAPQTPNNSTLQSIVAQFAARHVSTLREFTSFHEVLKRSHYFMYIFSDEMMERLVQLEKEVS
ncbi:hypothetical protein BDV38DRAFT_288550 [Aspergillus pseudotamarii]|uniref:BTB domain-containing protein n=1 Tax=Aspergillus pseudotamarii TaxID=132259 RepID=A0A5N6SA63_ASPPS|nr:uncharacterized protein BDV38DRAFT_288550 [Aspergillus pseudotamarii]KAE8131606.1 hypothetical protein BDV38DRAFT_288550 [Aspergillus pseudotamarii]